MHVFGARFCSAQALSVDLREHGFFYIHQIARYP
jgi:hypothetical protein